MRKLLYIIFLFPFLSLSQDIKLDHSYIESAPFKVGDEVTIKFNIVDNSNGEAAPTLLMFDYQYNNKLLEKVSHTFKVSSNGTNTNAQTTLRHWDGYKFSILNTYDAKDLDNQYTHGWLNRRQVSGNTNSYPTNADWSVERIIIQDGIPVKFGDALIEIKFKVKDRQGTGFANYEEVTMLNLAKIENSSSTLLNTEGMTMKINLDNQGDVTGVNAGAVTINLQSAAKTNHATDFDYKIFLASGVNGKTGNAIKTGSFDANGQIITSPTDLTIGVPDFLEIDVKDNANWLDNVLTVADAFLIFKEAIGAEGNDGPGGTTNSTTFTYLIQNLLGDLTNNETVDFDDSYQALAHINGVENLSQHFTSAANGSKDVWGEKNQYGVATNDFPYGQKYVFTPTDATKTFDFGHGLIGDVNFSHSFTPTNASAGVAQGNVAFPQTMISTVPNFTINGLKDPILSNLDIVSELVEGTVEVTINLAEEGLAGAQFNIKYDNSILTLDNVIFDTGNEMTNFTNHKIEKSLIVVGSLDSDGDMSIKTGNAYKLVFTPNQALNNTSGLITFDFNEGVKQDGQRVKFNIQ